MSSPLFIQWRVGGGTKHMSKKHRKIKYRQQKDVDKDKAEAFGFISKINFILSKIRETNIGMMETVPKDDANKQTITRVVFPPEGGVFTYFENLEHPAKGFCYGETVETVDEVKKTLKGLLFGFFEVLSTNKIRTLLFAILFRKQFKTIAMKMVVTLDYRMRRVRQKPEKYCRCARETYRVFNLMMIWYPDYKEVLESFRNIFCMILEYDDAYRYPFQDIIAEFNDTAGRKDIVKEIKRMLEMTIQRDSGGFSQKFKRIISLLFLLRFKKSIREALRRFFLELNLDEIRMDEADKFHAHFKEWYNWDHDKDEKEKKEEKKEI